MASAAQRKYGFGTDNPIAPGRGSLRPASRAGTPPLAVTRTLRFCEPLPLIAGLAQAIAEVLAGVRSARQLDDLLAPDVIRLLCRSAGRLSARPGSSHYRPIVHSVHVGEPCPGVAEACAVLNVGARKRAIALRLEANGRNWRCTVLHVG
jgi:hypothetical protein